MSANTIRKFINKWGSRFAGQAYWSQLTVQHDKYRVIQSFKFEKHKYAHQHLEKKKSYKIAFIISEMRAFGGGVTSVLRLGTYLAELGHQVYYIDISGCPIEKVAQNARINLPHYKGTLVPKDALSDEYDIGIATFWTTAYHLDGRDNFSYKCYFIQDFEPAFYPLGGPQLSLR